MTQWIDSVNHSEGSDNMYLDDGGNELFQEVVAQQRRPVMVDEVDQQALNVGAILILSRSQEYSRYHSC